VEAHSVNYIVLYNLFMTCIRCYNL